MNFFTTNPVSPSPEIGAPLVRPSWPDIPGPGNDIWLVPSDTYNTDLVSTKFTFCCFNTSIISTIQMFFKTFGMWWVISKLAPLFEWSWTFGNRSQLSSSAWNSTMLQLIASIHPWIGYTALWIRRKFYLFDDQQFLHLNFTSFSENYPTKIFIFSNCNCRKGLCDAHGLKSAGIVKVCFHEGQQMLPLEVATEANQNDRLRTSQTFPGAIQRRFWTLMQAPETRDRMLKQHFYHLTLT